MKNIEHTYKNWDIKICGECGHKENINEGIIKYNINEYDLLEIVNIIAKNHNVIKCDKCNIVEKTKIHVTEIDDMVERFYPDISEIPEGEYHPDKIYDDEGNLIVSISGFGGGGYSDNVWLDASLAVQKELENMGFKIDG